MHEKLRGGRQVRGWLGVKGLGKGIINLLHNYLITEGKTPGGLSLLALKV